LHGKASDRKLRLFAVACCRRVGHFLTDARARDALATAERFADRLADDPERSAARKAAQQAAQGRGVTRRPQAPKWERRAASAVYYALARDAWEAARNAPQLARESLFWRAGGHAAPDAFAVRAAERSSQARALRDIFGNPFRPVAADPAWRAGEVLALARAAYGGLRLPAGTLDPDRLAVLADALEETGCASADLLAHLRSGGEHPRGCWALDLALGEA
jgi:hypothetical protein